MLGGAHRPAPPNYLGMACKAFRQAMNIHESLWPFMEEQRKLVERLDFEAELKAALDKVYGQPDQPDPQSLQTGKEMVKKR